LKTVGEKFYLTLHPRPAYVIGSGVYNVKANFMAASWVMPASMEPPRVVIAIDMESYTWELIREYGEFTVNVLTEQYLDKIYYVGSRSGRDVDKVSTLNLNVSKGEKVNAPVILDAIAILECKVYNTVECGDTVLIIGDVVRCVADEKLFSDRYGWNIREAGIPLHLWGRCFTVPRIIRFIRK